MNIEYGEEPDRTEFTADAESTIGSPRRLSPAIATNRARYSTDVRDATTSLRRGEAV
jgi:hypothetical protein